MGRKFECNSAAKQRMAGKDYYAVVYGRVLRRGTEFMVVLVRVNCSQSNKFVAEARNRKKVEHSRGIERKIQAFSEAHCKFRAGYGGCSVGRASLFRCWRESSRAPSDAPKKRCGRSRGASPACDRPAPDAIGTAGSLRYRQQATAKQTKRGPAPRSGSRNAAADQVASGLRCLASSNAQT